MGGVMVKNSSQPVIRKCLTEDQEQIWLISWCELQSGKYPELALLHHIPNGGKRSIREATVFRAMGVKAGVPDLCLPVPRGNWHGLYIELKALDGKPTAKQKEFLRALRAQGYFAVVCYGGEQASKIITRYLDGKIDTDEMGKL